MFAGFGSWVLNVVVLPALLLGLSVIPFFVFNLISGALHGPQVIFPVVAIIAALLSGGWALAFPRPKTSQ